MPQKYMGVYGSHILSTNSEDFEKDKAWFYELSPLEQVSTLANSYIYITSPNTDDFVRELLTTLQKLPPEDFPSVRAETDTENDIEGAIYFSPLFLFLCKYTISTIGYYNNLIDLAQEWENEKLSPNATIIDYSDGGKSEEAWDLVDKRLIDGGEIGIPTVQSSLNRMLFDNTLRMFRNEPLSSMPVVKDYLTKDILGERIEHFQFTLQSLINDDFIPDSAYPKQLTLANIFNEMKDLFSQFALYNYAVAVTYYTINTSEPLPTSAYCNYPYQFIQKLTQFIGLACTIASSEWDLPHRECGGEWRPHYEIASSMIPFLVSGESLGRVGVRLPMWEKSDVCSPNPLFPIKYISTIEDIRIESASDSQFYGIYSIKKSPQSGRAFNRDWASSRLIISYEPASTNDYLPLIGYEGVNDPQEISRFMNYSRFGFSFGGHKGI